MRKLREFFNRLVDKYRSVQILLGSFIVVILAGTILLGLPIFNNLKPLGIVDNLFIATSATCVTGLMPVVTMEQFNLGGQIILLILIQIGGLGLMSFMALFVIITRKRLGHSNKQLVMDSLNKFNLSNFNDFLKSIFKYTLIFESIGTILFMIKFIPEYGIGSGFFKALFLSVSSFCNAGIDNISNLSLFKYQNSVLINLVVMALIILGGLGFTVWFDLKDSLKAHFKKELTLYQLWNRLLVHTKVVLVATTFLLSFGFVFILFVEYNNVDTLGTLSFGNKIMAALFSSTTLRTAGFATIDFNMLTRATKTMMLVFMLIGGSPGGTAGGIKTSTIVILLLTLNAQIKGKENLTIFHREIDRSSFRKAFLIATLYLAAIFIAMIILSMTENFDYLSILFETCSAIGTVGLSCGITASLSTIGKLIITGLMLMGRVGPVTIVLSFTSAIKRKENSVRYSKAELLVG